VPAIHLLISALYQGRNHVFKVGAPIPWSRLLYRTKYGWYTQFHALLRKKLGWSVQLLGVRAPLPTPHRQCMVAPLRCICVHVYVAYSYYVSLLTSPICFFLLPFYASYFLFYLFFYLLPSTIGCVFVFVPVGLVLVL